MNDLPFVSVVIPCRNEAKYIGPCLDSIVANGYPKDKIEVLVVNGMSEDGTREVLRHYTQQYLFIRMLDNHKKITPAALNIGIKNAKGEIIVRMDAHNTYEQEYISKCVESLYKYDADNVGGIWKIVPGGNSLISKAIALALSNSFGAGDAHYKVGYSGEPIYVDTVPFGCYKKEVFAKIGLYNENLVRSQDMDFNMRLTKAGGKILLVPDIISYYYPKSNLKDFFLHTSKSGIWAIYALRFAKAPMRLRHYVPFIFVSSLLGTGLLGIFFPIFFWLFLCIIGLYFLFSVFFSARVAVKQKDFRFLYLMPVVFAARQIGYGIGSICGLFKMLIDQGKAAKKHISCIKLLKK